VIIKVTERSGHCRWCGCTDDQVGESGTWANRQRTLCSACTLVDSLMQKVGGRAAVARLVRADYDAFTTTIQQRRAERTSTG
jgi:hypothetical protein